MSKTDNLDQKSDLEAVEIKIEKPNGRKRQLFAKIHIPYSVEQVWQVITDYESFTEFMPGMTQSQRLDHPTGGIRLEQIRSKSFMGMKKTGRSVFDLEEKFLEHIHYQLVEGELEDFSGYWRLEPCKSSEGTTGTALIYDLSILPKPIFPGPLVDIILNQEMPAGLLAIRQRVDKLFG
ncbi:MAG: SRPBCC family protein [Calothrix sp. MO_167.B42]|nr:SRPBCC family protein [Calothrix sp. MO_167.B42]